MQSTGREHHLYNLKSTCVLCTPCSPFNFLSIFWAKIPLLRSRLHCFAGAHVLDAHDISYPFVNTSEHAFDVALSSLYRILRPRSKHSVRPVFSFGLKQQLWLTCKIATAPQIPSGSFILLFCFGYDRRQQSNPCRPSGIFWTYSDCVAASTYSTTCRWSVKYSRCQHLFWERQN